MSLDSVLVRLNAGDLVTRVTPPQPAGVALKPSPLLSVTPVTPATPSNIEVQKESRSLPVTLDYFSAMGVNLLADDLAFIRRHLPMTTAEHNTTVRGYVRRWHEAMDAEPQKHKKDNAGRRAANTWLRNKTTNTAAQINSRKRLRGTNTGPTRQLTGNKMASTYEY